MKPVLLLTIVVSLAHVVMVHSTHASDPPAEHAATPHLQHHAATGGTAGVDLNGVESAHQDSETCPAPAWVTHRPDVLDETGALPDATTRLPSHTADVELAALSPDGSRRLDGPDRQALTQVFRL